MSSLRLDQQAIKDNIINIIIDIIGRPFVMHLDYSTHFYRLVLVDLTSIYIIISNDEIVVNKYGYYDLSDMPYKISLYNESALLDCAMLILEIIGSASNTLLKEL